MPLRAGQTLLVLPLFVVDAFTDVAFRANPAAAGIAVTVTRDMLVA